MEETIEQVSESNQVQQQQQPQNSLGWRAALPDEFKEHDFVKEFKAPGDFVKTALKIKEDSEKEINTLKAKMANAIMKPDKKATEDEWNAYYKAIGRPDTPDGYTIEAKEGEDGEIVKWYKSQAYKLGLTNEQALSLMAETDKRVQEFRAARLAKDMEAIKKEWGNDFDKNVAIVKSAQEKLFGDEQAKRWLTEHNAENDPVLTKLLFNIGKMMLDDSALFGKSTSPVKIGMVYDSMERFKGG